MNSPKKLPGACAEQTTVTFIDFVLDFNEDFSFLFPYLALFFALKIHVVGYENRKYTTDNCNESKQNL